MWLPPRASHRRRSVQHSRRQRSDAGHRDQRREQHDLEGRPPASTAQPRCLMRRARLSSCPRTSHGPHPHGSGQITVASDATGAPSTPTLPWRGAPTATSSSPGRNTTRENEQLGRVRPWYTATGTPMPTFNEPNRWRPTRGASPSTRPVANVQRNSTVSMDNQGDAVIACRARSDGDG